MKKSFLILAILLLSLGMANATEKDGFVLNVKTDGAFLKEIDGIAELPFDTEYTILLKNANERRCSARVFTDGVRVSPNGDFVISPNSELELERFVTDLEKGRKFKFVPLDNPAVDDPTRKENGLIRVEFRLEKSLQINPDGFYGYPDWDIEWYLPNCDCDKINGTLFDCNCDAARNFIFDTSLSSTTIPTGSITDDSLTTSISNGATITGSESTQKFKKVNYDFEDEFVTLELRLRGIPLGTLTILKEDIDYWNYSAPEITYTYPDIYTLKPLKTITAYELFQIMEAAGLRFYFTESDYNKLSDNLKQYLIKE